MNQNIQSHPWPSLGEVKHPESTIEDEWTPRKFFQSFFKTYSTINKKLKVKAGTLFSKVPAQEFKLGEFTLTWTGSDTEPYQLCIKHSQCPSEILWSSPQGENFVGGADVSLYIVEERGSLVFDETFNRSFPNQIVEKIEQKGDTLVISGYLEGENIYDPWEKYILSFRASHPKALDFNLQIDGKNASQAQLRFNTSIDEQFYGFGEQFSEINAKGYEIPIVTQEGGVGRGDDKDAPIPFVLRLIGTTGNAFTSYSPVPQFLTNQGRCVFLTNTEPSVFDLRDSEVISIRVQASIMTGKMIAGSTPLDLIETYTEFVGRLPALPDWVHQGAIAGLQGGTSKVREIWAKLKEYNTPLAGFWLQDWVGQRTSLIGKQLWWNWDLDTHQYPNWNELVKDLEAEGIKIGIYVNPFLVCLQPDQLKGRRHLYDEALKNNFLVETSKGTVELIKNTSFSAALIDLSNPKTRTWFKEIIKTEMLGIGAKFWMADFSEAAPFDGKFASGEPGISYHNQYPVDWAQINREAIDEAGQGNEAWFFTRAGFLKTPSKTTAMWLGDQNTSWGENDGLPSSIDGMLSSGFSGFSISHSDTGGYTSFSNRFLEFLRIGFSRSQELLFRWMEVNAFTSIFRTHEGNQPSINVQFYSNEETYRTFSYWAKVYAALGNYRKKLMNEAQSKGYPVVRHPVLHYPNDKKLYKVETQEREFMLGSEFLIAPVLHKGVTRKRVYLPADKWVYLWSGEEFDNSSNGNWYDIDAPLGKPPVFYRQDSQDAKAVVEILKQEKILDY